MKAEVTKNWILIAESTDYLVWFNRGKIICCSKSANLQIFSDNVYEKISFTILSKVRLIQRVYRLTPRCGLFVSKDQVIVSVHGAIVLIDISKKRLRIEHKYRLGMNNTLSFTSIKGLNGFDDCIVYGEYFANKSNEEVCIHKRGIDGKWRICFRFQPNTIRHIHRIVTDIKNDCLYVFTGDEDSESGIWRITDNFKTVTKVAVGSQQYRACVGYPFNRGFFYVTDTPYETNSVYYTPNIESEPKSIMDIEGPCIYGTKISDELFAFATSVEPDARLTGWRYLITYRRGRGVKSRKSVVYIGNPQVGFIEALVGEKDSFPMGLFEFGTFLFPECIKEDSDSLYVNGQGLKGYDGKTIRINLKGLFNE